MPQIGVFISSRCVCGVSAAAKVVLLQFTLLLLRRERERDEAAASAVALGETQTHVCGQMAKASKRE